MLEEEEEDVIAKNSPLYQYLKETECSEFLHQDDEIIPDNGTISTSDLIPHKEPKSYCQLLKHFVKYLFHPSKELNSLDEDYRRKCYQSCMDSNLVFEDDKRFLSSYLDDALYESSSGMQWVSLKIGVGILLSTLPVNIWFKSQKWLTNYLMAPVGIIGTCVLIVGSYKKFLTWKQQNLHDSNLKLFESVISSSSNISKRLKESIRLIQESEIIARGFTIATVKDAIMRMENNSSAGLFHQCFPLRKQVFSSANNLFMKVRDLTNCSIKSVPLSEDIDNASNYLSGVPLDQFQLKDVLDEDDSKSKTLTVSNLKLVTERYYLQQSELITRLVLIHFPDYICTNAHRDRSTALKNNVTHVTGVLERILELNEAAGDELNKSYHFHKCLLDGEDVTSNFTASDNKESRNVRTSIHSIYLHLQAALTRVREFENLLDRLETNLNNDEDKVVQVTSMLNLVMEELRTCSDCVEESFTTMNQAEDSPGDNTVPEQPKDKLTSSTQSENCIHLWNVDEPVIGDPRIEQEIFEGTVEKYQEEYQKLSYNELTEEMIKKKSEVEHAVKLYRELKSVLKVRASETQLKEEETLQKLKNSLSGNELHAVNLNEVTDTETIANIKPLPPSAQLSTPILQKLPRGADADTGDILDASVLRQNIKEAYNIPSGSLSFSANVAAMAVAKSQSLGLHTLVTEEFLGDDSCSD